MFVFFIKGGEMATNRIDEQEVSALALHLLQASYGRMAPEDYRGLTPLIYARVNPYGRFNLDLDSRIDFDGIAA